MVTTCPHCGREVTIVNTDQHEVYVHQYFHMTCTKCGKRSLTGVIYYGNEPADDILYCTACAAEHECNVERAGLVVAHHVGGIS